jgi:glucose/arabinose dehydrogenase
MLRSRLPRHLTTLALCLALVACSSPPQGGSGSTPASAPPAEAPAAPPGEAPAASQPRQPISGGPTLLRDGITLRRVGPAGAGSIRLAQNPQDGAVYALHTGNGLKRIDLETGVVSQALSLSSLVGDASPTGMAFGPDGTLYVVANRGDGKRNVGVIRRGSPDDSASWATLAETEPYPISGTQFDHLFNGVAVSPDGAWVYVNSGSRTDHGEVQDNGGSFPDEREGPLTSRIFRLPADGGAITLPNDEAAVAPYVFARGTRNAYDLAFAPNGDLFGVDNGPDADFPDELNWLREGRHYGFPWRFGTVDNPQQFPGYDPRADGRLSSDFVAVQRGTYRDDPGFPAPPQELTSPVANSGPAAAIYRAEDGEEQDAAANGEPLHTFTPHRSPLGLLFADGEGLPADLRGDEQNPSAFVLSWGAAGGDLSDQGQDLLHLALAKGDDGYSAVTTQIARDFKRPIDSLLIDNRLYVLEFDGQAIVWELSFE